MEFEENMDAQLDPELERLLDAKLYGEKVEILYNMRDRLTDEMIRTICITHDIQLNATDVEEQYRELRDYMTTMKKYEGNRLR
ncbi:MAG: hypothetical protein J6Y57_08905 [Lachnospiraceae bacterium]|nr:hypothetical protein [Lachnospiraceae bacterium]